MTRSSLFRASLARGPAVGTWIKIPAVEIVELVALAGFDFVVIDLEHSPLTLESCYRLIGVALQSGVSPVVRLPGHDFAVAQRVLDSGAEGIMVPHVDSVAEASSAAAAVRFPPLGVRGVGSTSRAGLWGSLDRDEYLRYGNEEVVLIAQIENAAGVAAASGIAASCDALLVGAADLSVSLGASESDPSVRSLIASVVSAGRSAGVPVGNAGGASPSAVRSSLEAGFGFTLLSNDASLFGAAARDAVESAHAVILERTAVHG